MKWFIARLLGFFVAFAVTAHYARAQTYQSPAGGGYLVRAQQLSTAVSNAGLTNILALNVVGIRRLHVHCVVAGFALSAFQINGQPLLAPAQVVLYSTTADFTTPKGALIGTSGDLSVQAVGTGWFFMETAGADLILLKATSSNVAGSTVSCYASGSAS